MLALAARKVRREIKYTILLTCILGSGLASWILLPSISNHLETSLYDYSTRVATYISVSPKGEFGGPKAGRLFPEVIQQMRNTHGVQFVYPFTTNVTVLEFSNVTIAERYPNGTTATVTGPFKEGVYSAPLGVGHYPSELINLAEGRMPQTSEAGFISVCNAYVDVQRRSQLTINATYNIEVSGVKFNATVTGRSVVNPVYADLCALWNPSFLEQKLGPVNFTATFGGNPNYAIIKVDSIDNVRKVVDSLKNLLRGFPGYVPIYDEAALVNLQNLQQQSGPLYRLIGWITPLSTASIAFLTSFMAMGRRSWEGGLLISQGWNKRRVFGFVFYYYGLISIVAFLLGAALSYGISIVAVFKYPVYGATLVISTPLSLLYLFSSLPLVLGISASLGLLETTRLRRLRLETALRDY